MASGGAIYSTGDITPVYTRFVANKAGVQGMAVTSLGVLYNPEPNFFENNARYCPLGQYGYDEDIKVVVRLKRSLARERNEYVNHVVKMLRNAFYRSSTVPPLIA